VSLRRAFTSVFGRPGLHGLADYAPCSASMAPWQLLPSAMLSDREYRARYMATYEQDGRKVASSRTTMPVRQDLCEGVWKAAAWAGMYGTSIEQLRYFDPNDLVPSENPYDGRSEDVARYRDWLAAGNDPPPIKVVQYDDGRFGITDGHRRWAAAKELGRRVPAWVSPSMRSGSMSWDGKPIMTGLTWEGAVQDAIGIGAPVPQEIRARLAESEKKNEELHRRRHGR